MGIEGLVITGVVTNGCVEQTAYEAADWGYSCIIVKDGCAAWDQASHEATLRTFARIYGYVRTTQEVIDEFTSKLG